MSRPKYKELYLEEKSKEIRFSYHLLKNIVDMLNKLGLEAEIEKRFNKYARMNTVILKVHNPSNNLICCLEIKEDLLEEGEE